MHYFNIYVLCIYKYKDWYYTTLPVETFVDSGANCTEGAYLLRR